jgi:ferredoxin
LVNVNGPAPPERTTRQVELQDQIERKIGDLTIRIDRLLCVGFGDCIEEAAEAFEFDGDGIVTFKEGIAGVSRERLIEACRSCPVDALTLLDPNGLVLAP